MPRPHRRRGLTAEQSVDRLRPRPGIRTPIAGDVDEGAEQLGMHHREVQCARASGGESVDARWRRRAYRCAKQGSGLSVVPWLPGLPRLPCGIDMSGVE
jgi:hypothetical protein